jgi:hypothetical protein
MSNSYTFTITSTFAADNQQDAWDMFVDWLHDPLNVEDGTVVGPVLSDDPAVATDEVLPQRWLAGGDEPADDFDRPVDEYDDVTVGGFLDGLQAGGGTNMVDDR